MPVQINEMVIRANILETGDAGNAKPAKPSSGSGDANKAEIVKECVEIIMEILNSKTQR